MELGSYSGRVPWPLTLGEVPKKGSAGEEDRVTPGRKYGGRGEGTFTGTKYKPGRLRDLAALLRLSGPAQDTAPGVGRMIHRLRGP